MCNISLKKHIELKDRYDLNKNRNTKHTKISKILDHLITLGLQNIQMKSVISLDVGFYFRDNTSICETKGSDRAQVYTIPMLA